MLSALLNKTFPFLSVSYTAESSQQPTREGGKDSKSESAGFKAEDKENCFPSKEAKEQSATDKENGRDEASAEAQGIVLLFGRR